MKCEMTYLTHVLRFGLHKKTYDKNSKQCIKKALKTNEQLIPTEPGLLHGGRVTVLQCSSCHTNSKKVCDE